MSSRADLLKQQQNWAKARGLNPDDRGYLSELDSNLFQPLSAQTRTEFDSGSGSELVDSATRPAKMKALHSSSALAVNVFDYWVNKGRAALRNALRIDGEISSVTFEAQFPTGLTGNPPNIDVALGLTGGHVVGIESKFSEWLTPGTGGKEPFKPKYFPSGQKLWESNGLAASQELAARINGGEIQFRYLDAPQLLKHALGLSTQLDDRFSLYYVYLDWPGEESAEHHREINLFGDHVGDETRFRAFSYQLLVQELGKESGVDADYLDYLDSRYCSNRI